jgi:RNA polymerase sigma factor (sigma-70 family)
MTDRVEQRDKDFLRRWVLNHWDLVNRLAGRRFSDDIVAEEAALYVMETLSKKDWAILRRHRGRARLKTFFVAVVYNQLEDFSRKRFGRVRPPRWLKKLGGIWLLLYRLLCLERRSYLEATSRAGERFQQFSEAQVEAMADRILAEIVSCGSPQSQQEPFTEDLHGKSLSRSTEQRLEEKERALVFASLKCQFFGTAAGEDIGQALISLAGCPVALTSEERLLLRLCHVEGFSVSEAGKKLGLNRFQAHGKLRRLYKRIRKKFESEGHGEALRTLLEAEPDTK